MGDPSGRGSLWQKESCLALLYLGVPRNNGSRFRGSIQ